MKNSIDTSIEQLISTFRVYPDIFLTEDDVRCHLFSLLNQKPKVKLIYNTNDQSQSTPLHTEVRWYGKSGKLKYRSDIVILDPRTLRTKGKRMELPSKGYGFNHFWAIIELKLRRINGGSDNHYLEKIKDEIIKLKKIIDETRGRNKHKASFYVLCLDKKNDIGDRLRDIRENQIALKYVFSIKESPMKGDVNLLKSTPYHRLRRATGQEK